MVLLNEMVHNARIIPLDGRAHLDHGIRQWTGDSRGHWEGDTLVVETTNFLQARPSYQAVAAKVMLPIDEWDAAMPDACANHRRSSSTQRPVPRVFVSADSRR